MPPHVHVKAFCHVFDTKKLTWTYIDSPINKLVNEMTATRVADSIWLVGGVTQASRFEPKLYQYNISSGNKNDGVFFINI